MVRRTVIDTLAQLREALLDWPDDARVLLSDGGRVVVEIHDGDETPIVYLTDETDYIPAR